MMTMNKRNKRLFNSMESNASGAKNTYTQLITIVDNWKAEIYGKYPNGNTGRPGETQKATMVMKDLQRVIEGSIPSICEPFLADSDIVGVQGNDAESAKKAPYVQQLLNKQFSRTGSKSTLIEQIARTLQVEGTVFVKVGWGEDMPALEQINLMEIMIDPSARQLKDAKFVIQRRKLSKSDILNNPAWFGKHTMESLSKLTSSTESEYEPENTLTNDDSFNFDDDARELVEVFEYYGMMDVDNNGTLKPIMGIFSNNMLLNFVDSPYPDSWNGNPFDSCVYTSRPFELYGDGIAPLIGDYQKVRTGFMREVLNNAQKANSTQVATRKGSIDIANKRKFINGEHYEYNGAEPGIIPATFNQIPESIFHLVEGFKVEEEELSGISRMNAGADQRQLANKTATASNLQQDNAEKRLTQISGHIATMLESVFSKWIDLNRMMLQESSVMARGQRLPVNGMMFEGKYNLEVTAITAGMKTKQNENSLMLLNILSPMVETGAVSQDIIMSIVANLADNVDMPQLAQTLRDDAEQKKAQEEQSQGQPDLAEQLAMKRETVEIANLESETIENEADARKKDAETLGVQVDTEMTTLGYQVKIG